MVGLKMRSKNAVKIPFFTFWTQGLGNVPYSRYDPYSFFGWQKVVLAQAGYDNNFQKFRNLQDLNLGKRHLMTRLKFSNFHVSISKCIISVTGRDIINLSNFCKKPDTGNRIKIHLWKFSVQKFRGFLIQNLDSKQLKVRNKINLETQKVSWNHVFR